MFRGNIFVIMIAKYLPNAIFTAKCNKMTHYSSTFRHTENAYTAHVSLYKCQVISDF